MEQKSKRGFAAVPSDTLRKIASLGGKASQKKKGNKLTTEQKQKGGRTGGEKTLRKYGVEFLKKIASKKKRKKKMSHVVEMKLAVKSLSALAQAAHKLGMTLREKNTYKKYYPGSPGECDYALCVTDKPSAYEVGVKLQPDGTYKLLWDFYNGGYGLQQHVGQDGLALILEYETQVIYEQAAALGHVIQEDYWDEYGNRQIVVVEQ